MSEAAVLEPVIAPPETGAEADVIGVAPLGAAAVGARGVIVRVAAVQGALEPAELERRLLELGFVEGAAVEVLEEGLFGRDPIAVRLDDMRVAIRRREAAAVLVRFDAGASD